jgi:hypothetical protein
MKSIKIFIKFFMVLFIYFFFINFYISASDRTDALDLKDKSEKGSKQLEIVVKNFGDKADLNEFDKGLNLIKAGNVNILQSNFLEASAKFNEYLKLEYDTYKSLAAKYIQRVEDLIKETSNDLIDSISIDGVQKNFTTSSSHLNNAKSSFNTKHYQDVIMSSRIAKKYLFANYDLADKKLPDKYQKDFADCGNKIF